MTPAILTLNAGSSSLKFAAFETGDGGVVQRLKGQVGGIGSRPTLKAVDAAGESVGPGDLAGVRGHGDALNALLKWLEPRLAGLDLRAVGHRVVHGGDRYRVPVRVDDDVLHALHGLVPLAPLHQPHNLAAIEALARLRPGLPQVACFDTAFHADQPAIATRFALPHELTEEGIRRYGFHGLSYEYVAGVLPECIGATASGRVVVMHLGNGASMCALRDGRSVATTMGFTAVDGLPMGTRCGALDPGVVIHLMEQKGMALDEVRDLLYHRSGLLGVSGVSGDMRELMASDSPRAAEAVDLYVYRIARELGSLAAALEGLDAVVFTAGIGEHQPDVRARVCRSAAWLGVSLDEPANQAHGPRISTPDSAVSAWVVPTDEEAMIARHCLRHIA